MSSWILAGFITTEPQWEFPHHILDSTYKSYHMIIFSLFRTYFTCLIISRSIHVVANGIISYFLWLSSIPLCVCVCVCLCVCIPHLLYSFICQWTFRLLPCLAYCNSVSMNTEVHVSFWIEVFIFSGYMPRSGITQSYGNSMFSFLRNFHKRFL